MVPWCDGHCTWEYETDDLPASVPVGDEVAEAEYLRDYGHPPFRWHSKLWPSGILLEQNEFAPHTDAAYVAENGRLMITATADPDHPGSDRRWTKDDLPTIPQMVARLPLLAAEHLTAAAAIVRNAPDRLVLTFGDDKIRQRPPNPGS